MQRKTGFAITTLLSILAACGDDPVSYSEPVAIELKAESGKVVNDTLSEEKSITTESGNPYGAFISNATDTLGGREPLEIGLDSATVTLAPTSTGVSNLGEIFEGNFEVFFVMNDTNDSVPVAARTIGAETGGGPETLDVSFDSTTLSADNYDKLLGGSFKVVYRAPAQVDFANANAKGDLQLTFSFTAFE